MIAESHYKDSELFFLPFQLQNQTQRPQVIQAILYLLTKHPELGLNTDAVLLAASFFLFSVTYKRQVCLTFCLGSLFANWFKPQRSAKDFCFQMTTFCHKCAQKWFIAFPEFGTLDQGSLKEMLAFYSSLFQYVRGTQVLVSVIKDVLGIPES